MFLIRLGRIGGNPVLAFALLCLAGSGQALSQDNPAPAITVAGVQDEALLNNLLGHIEAENEACNASQLRLQRLVPRVRQRVIDAGRALGYYQISSTPRFTAGDPCWQLVLDVMPGPRILLETVDIQVTGDAAVQASFSDILQNAPLRQGAPLHHGQYETLKNALSTRAADLGYFAARFDQAEIALDLLSYMADINLHFNPGERFRFGTVNIRHDGSLSDELIRGLIPVEDGDAYSTEQLAELRESLDTSQYFEQISVSPQLGQTSGTVVPLDVQLAMRPQHAWTGGIGFTTDTGPRARMQYENRFVNRRGHKWMSDAAVSQVRSQIDASYSIPLADAARQSLNFATGYSFDNNDSFESKRFKLEASLRNESRSGWLQTAFIEFLRDDYVVAGQEETSILTMPGISLSRTEADDLINTSRGWKLFTQLRGASNSFVSDSTFVQLYGSAKYIFSFGRSRLLSRLEMGATWIDAASDLPASLRYFAGGDQSIRGYDYRSQGPLDENGEVIGGKQLIVGGLEYDFQVRNNWRVAVFADSGNAFNDRSVVEWQHSVGVGLRWQSPIGPVRVDLAHPIDAEESFRLHITMGPDL